MAGGLKILLVEDNAGDARLLKEAVLSTGHNCTIDHAENGAEALDYLGDWAETVDIVVTDLNMPKMTGHELLKRMKASERLKAIPVIILTTSASEADRNDCELHGAATFLTKPIELDAYEQLIRSVLNFWTNVVYGDI